MDFKTQLVRKREEIGWSRSTLAARAGITWSTVQKIETGAREPSIYVMRSIALAVRNAGYPFHEEVEAVLGLPERKAATPTFQAAVGA